MSTRRRSQSRRFVHTFPSVMVFAAVGVLALLACRPAVAGPDGPAAAASGDQLPLTRLARGQNADSPLWWLARAEQQAGHWGNAFQQAYSLTEIAKLLADGDQIEAALAVAQRIDHGPALLSARYRIAAAHARAGEPQAAEALARLSTAPDGRPEPDGYVEFNCHIGQALAGVGRIEQAEKILTTLGRRPSKWTGKWEPPGNLVSVKARIHAAVAAASAKAGRREAYRKHIQKAEALAQSIPGDINEMWGRALSSRAKPTDPPGPNPMGAIYKTRAIQSGMLARAEAGDYQAARKTLELIPAGRHRDTEARSLVEVLTQKGELNQARTVADAIETPDHRDRAYLLLVAAYVRAGNLADAKALAAQMGQGDLRALAEIHVAVALGGSGRAGNVQAILDAAAAEAQRDATSREQWDRARAATPPGIPPPLPPPSRPRLHAKLYREVAHVLADTRDRDKLAAWIKTLPGPDSRFYALLGVAEQLLQAR